jgi:mevalonate kinase
MQSRPPEPSAAVGSAPAKLILFGEHSVVYGEPAVGLALSRGVKATLRPGSGRVETRLAPGVPGPARPPPGSGAERLAAAALGEALATHDVEIEIGVPPAAGLGSSAAIAVALLRAKGALEDEHLDRDMLLEAAIRIEHLAHGRSSGLDPAICVEGGLIRFQRVEDRPRLAPVRLGASFHLTVGVLGSHGGTGARVRGIAELRARATRVVDAAFGTLGAAATAGIDALVAGELDRAGALLDLAHGVLSGLGLVGDGVEAHVREARRLGALGAKMSGAGGAGGAFLALAPDVLTAQAIETAWRAAGAEAWVETAS